MANWTNALVCSSTKSYSLARLHHAAWHGVSVEVVRKLLKRGALRSLKDAEGRTAYDIALEHGRRIALLKLLELPPSPLDSERIRALDRHLAELIEGRVALIEGPVRQRFRSQGVQKVLRFPPVEILHEPPGQRVWFPVPGMYGGFHIVLRRGYLEVESGCRVAAGSVQLHVVSRDGVVLVDNAPGY